HHDVLRPDADLSQSVLEPGGAARTFVLDTIDVVELRVLLVPRPGVDQHWSDVMLDQQTAHTELDAIALVGRNAALPQRLRHDAEHRAAIEPLATGLDRMHTPAAKLAALDERFGNHALVSSVTECGSAGARRGRLRLVPGPRISASSSSSVRHPRSRAPSSNRSSTCAVASASPPARCLAPISMPKNAATESRFLRRSCGN